MYEYRGTADTDKNSEWEREREGRERERTHRERNRVAREGKTEKQESSDRWVRECKGNKSKRD